MSSIRPRPQSFVSRLVLSSVMPPRASSAPYGPAGGRLFYRSKSIPLAEARLADQPVSARTRLRVEEVAYEIEQTDVIFRLRLFWDDRGKALASMLLSAAVVCFVVLPVVIQTVFHDPASSQLLDQSRSHETTEHPHQIQGPSISSRPTSFSSVCLASPLLKVPRAPICPTVAMDKSFTLLQPTTPAAVSDPQASQPSSQDPADAHLSHEPSQAVPIAEPAQLVSNPNSHAASGPTSNDAVVSTPPLSPVQSETLESVQSLVPPEAQEALGDEHLTLFDPTKELSHNDFSFPEEAAPPSRADQQPLHPETVSSDPPLSELEQTTPEPLDCVAELVPDSEYRSNDPSTVALPTPAQSLASEPPIESNNARAPQSESPPIAPEPVALEAELVPDFAFKSNELQPIGSLVPQSSIESGDAPPNDDDSASCVSEKPVAVSRNELPTLHIPSETYTHVQGIPDWQVYMGIGAVAFVFVFRFVGVRRDQPANEPESPVSRELIASQEPASSIVAKGDDMLLVDGSLGSPKKQDSAFLDDVPPTDHIALDPRHLDSSNDVSSFCLSLNPKGQRTLSPEPHSPMNASVHSVGDDSFSSSSVHSSQCNSSMLSSSGEYSMIRGMDIPPSCPPNMFLPSLPASIPSPSSSDMIADSARASVILDHSPVSHSVASEHSARDQPQTLTAYDLVPRGRTLSRSSSSSSSSLLLATGAGCTHNEPVVGPWADGMGQSQSSSPDGGSDSGQDVSEPSSSSAGSVSTVSTSSGTAARQLRRSSRSTSISSVRTAFHALPSAKSPPAGHLPPSAIPVSVARTLDNDFFEQGGKWVHVYQRKPNSPQLVSVPDPQGHVHLAIQRVELPLSRDRRPPAPAPADRLRSSSEVSNLSRVSSTSTLGSAYSDDLGRDHNVAETDNTVSASNGLLRSRAPAPAGMSGIPTLRAPHVVRVANTTMGATNGSTVRPPLEHSTSLASNGQLVGSPTPTPFLSGSYVQIHQPNGHRPATPPAAPLTPSRIPLPTSSPSSYTRIHRPPTTTVTATRELVGSGQSHEQHVEKSSLKRSPSDNKMMTIQEDERMYWTKRWERLLSKVPDAARDLLGAKFAPFQESTLNVFNRYDSGQDARGFGAQTYWSSMVREKATGLIHVAHVYEDAAKAHAVQKWSALVSKYFLSPSSTPSSPTLPQHPTSPSMPSHELRGRSFSMRGHTAGPRPRSPVSATSSTTSQSLASALVYNQGDILPLATGQGCVRITPLYLLGPMHLVYHADEHTQEKSPDMLARVVLKTLGPLLKVMDQLYKLRDTSPGVHLTPPTSPRAPTSLLQEALQTDWTVGHVLHPVAVHHASPLSRVLSFRYMVLDMVPTSVAADKQRSSCALLADFLAQTLNEDAVNVDAWLHVDRPEARPDARRIRYVLARLATVRSAHEFRDVRKLVARLFKTVSREQQKAAAAAGAASADAAARAPLARAATAPVTWSSMVTLVDGQEMEDGRQWD